MAAELRQLWKHRELLWILVERDLKVRYKNSLLGFGWSLLNPLFQAFVITLVLQFLSVGARTANYHVYVLCAVLPWQFVQSGIMDSSYSLILHHGLIRRTNFPREIIPLSSVLANLIHLGLGSLVFLVWTALVPIFWWALGQPFQWALQPTLLLAWIPVLGLLLLVSGISLVVSVWALYFEDVRFLLLNGLQVLYWLVPVLYFADLILLRNPWGRGELLYTLYMLNPVSAFVTAFRKLLLPPTTITLGSDAAHRVAGMTGQDWLFLGVALLLSLAVMIGGLRYFSARKWALAERA